MARDVAVQGLRLRLWDWAAPAVAHPSPTVLLVHGALDTGRSWDAVVTALQARVSVRAVALDLRGHGESDGGGVGASHHLLDFAKDIAGVIAWLEAEGAPVHTLVGHSMGANVVMLLAGAWPTRQRHLVLVDGLGPPPENPEDQPERLADLFDATVAEKRPFKPVASVDEGVERLLTWNPGLSRLGAERMVVPALRPRADGRFDFPFDPRLRGPTPMRHPESQWLAACDRLRAADVATTVLRASDGYLPEGIADAPLGSPFGERAERLRARVVAVEGPHHLHVEAPDDVAQAIADGLPR